MQSLQNTPLESHSILSISSQIILHHYRSVGVGVAVINTSLPLPERPTNLKSLNLATWFLKVAVALRSSAAQFSSFPAVSITLIPSQMSLSDRTLNGTGRVLLHLQCDGSIVHTKLGLFVRISSPGYSASTSENDLSPLKALGPLDTTGDSLSAGGEAIKTHILVGRGVQLQTNSQ